MKHMRNKYDIAAYFWPAYHDEPRWRRFMTEGEGEWQTIRKAKPKFPGHQQPRIPLWGYESDSDPVVMEKKINTAVSYGVNIFIYDWYWYENQPFLEESLDNGFLKARNNDQMKFYIMWANHDATTLWDVETAHQNKIIWKGGVDRATFDCIAERLIKKYFSHPSYYKIDGKPVLSIYETGTLINGLGSIEETKKALDTFRQKAIKAGFPGLHLQGILWSNIPATIPNVLGDRIPTQNNTVAYLGYDSLTNYQWCHYVRPRGDYKEWGGKAIAAWEKWRKEFSIPFFPHVSIGWDTNPRFKILLEDVITGNTPALFRYFLKKAMEFVDDIKLSPPLITINSWNEWAEGSYLEPDTTNGFGYLEAVKQALAGEESGTS